MSSNNAGPETESISQRLYKIWTYVSVEPLLFCLIVPSYFLYIASENLSLEKVTINNDSRNTRIFSKTFLCHTQSCRVNLKYSDIVCDNMIDKSINNINCPEFREKLLEPANQTIHLYSDRSQVINETHFSNGSAIVPPNSMAAVLFDISELEMLVCQAEIDSQILDTRINLITAPFGKY